MLKATNDFFHLYGFVRKGQQVDATRFTESQLLDLKGRGLVEEVETEPKSQAPEKAKRAGKPAKES